MKLSAPKQITWIIALVIGILGLIGYVVSLGFLTDIAFWLVLVALVLMLVATWIEGL